MHHQDSWRLNVGRKLRQRDGQEWRVGVTGPSQKTSTQLEGLKKQKSRGRGNWLRRAALEPDTNVHRSWLFPGVLACPWATYLNVLSLSFSFSTLGIKSLTKEDWCEDWMRQHGKCPTRKKGKGSPVLCGPDFARKPIRNTGKLISSFPSEHFIRYWIFICVN